MPSTKRREKRKTKPLDVVEDLERMVGDDPRLLDMIDEEELKSQIARLIYDARAAAGFSHAKLAKLSSTTPAAIIQAEDADDRGDLLTMLRRIAAALNSRAEVRLVAAPGAKPRRSRAA